MTFTSLIVGIISVVSCSAFTTTLSYLVTNGPCRCGGMVPTVTTPTFLFMVGDTAWQGEVVPDADGRIRGCTITPVTADSVGTEWTIAIDGVEADLGRFSDAIYKKFLRDAKQQRFQGFRPGTIPPHLEPTYRAYAMDECARETVLEALTQNSIRPFESCRSEMLLYSFRIPPPARTSKSKSKKRKGPVTAETEEPATDDADVWRTFETMKDAVDAGWKPGQSFSFLAKNVKGQKVKQESEAAGATPVVKPF